MGASLILSVLPKMWIFPSEPVELDAHESCVQHRCDSAVPGLVRQLLGLEHVQSIQHSLGLAVPFEGWLMSCLFTNLGQSAFCIAAWWLLFTSVLV